MDEIETNAAALADAIAADSNPQMGTAMEGLVVAFGMLLERGVVALETLAGTVDHSHNRPAILNRGD